MVFIATSIPIQEIPRDETNHMFFIHAVDGEFLPVVDKFSNPNVYYVGTSRGCGCDFGTHHTLLVQRPLLVDSIGDIMANFIIGSIQSLLTVSRKMLGVYTHWLEKQKRKEAKNIAENEAYEQDNSKLIKIIEANTNSYTTVELYCCWAGNYADESADSIEININEVKLAQDFYIGENTLNVYVRRSAN